MLVARNRQDLLGADSGSQNISLMKRVNGIEITNKVYKV